ncbi:hypothetical protein [Enterococcus hulanensis]|uniref:hypothetical protein n=1 Tax=Enterococcus hulanensis TaxID=2559929 RepID=UPI0020182C4C|nr:hypothetical protein [Enterococcus hulanensis]
MMKKSTLYTGLVYVLAGIVCLVIALTTEFRLESLLWGLAGAGIFSGVIVLGKYFYWMSPEHKNQYQDRLKDESVNLNDERKIMLRDKSGRLAYIAMLILQLALMIVFSIMSMLGYMSPFSKYACVGLSLLLVIHYIFGIVAYNRLSKTL